MQYIDYGDCFVESIDDCIVYLKNIHTDLPVYLKLNCFENEIKENKTYIIYVHKDGGKYSVVNIETNSEYKPDIKTQNIGKVIENSLLESLNLIEKINRTEFLNLIYKTELISLIDKCNIAYYHNDEPIISDSEYDKLVRKLQDIEGSVKNMLWDE